MFITKKLLWRVDKMANVKKENSEIWSEEAIDKLTNCFQSHECIWDVTSGDNKEQNRKSLPLEGFDMSVQEYNINRFDYEKMKQSLRPILTIRKQPPEVFCKKRCS